MFLRNKRMRVIIVGFGNIAKTHLENLRRIQHFETVGVADSNREALEANMGLLGGIPVFASLEEAVEKCAADVVLITTPHHLHYEQCRHAIGKGLHVFCEKPVCLTMGEFDELEHLAAARDRHLVVGQMMRFWPNVTWAKAEIASGRIGEVRHIIRDRITQQADAGNRAWAHDPSRAGGWLLYGTGVHELDALLYLSGARVQETYALGCRTNPVWNDYDDVCVTGRLTNGAVFSLNQTLNGGEFAITTRIIGTRGVLVLRQESDASLNGAPRRFPKDSSFHAQLMEFGRVLVNGGRHRADISAVRDTMKALELVKASISQGRPMKDAVAAC